MARLLVERQPTDRKQYRRSRSARTSTRRSYAFGQCKRIALGISARRNRRFDW